MLTYTFKHSESERIIIEQCYSQGRPLPDFIKDAPELCLGLDIFFKGFTTLTTCRPIGMSGVGSIPWTAMNDYCIHIGLTGEDHEDFCYLVSKIDQEYVKLVSAKHSK